MELKIRLDKIHDIYGFLKEMMQRAIEDIP